MEASWHHRLSPLVKNPAKEDFLHDFPTLGCFHHGEGIENPGKSRLLTTGGVLPMQAVDH